MHPPVRQLKRHLHHSVGRQLAALRQHKRTGGVACERGAEGRAGKRETGNAGTLLRRQRGEVKSEEVKATHLMSRLLRLMR